MLLEYQALSTKTSYMHNVLHHKFVKYHYTCIEIVLHAEGPTLVLKQYRKGTLDTLDVTKGYCL